MPLDGMVTFSPAARGLWGILVGDIRIDGIDQEIKGLVVD